MAALQREVGSVGSSSRNMIPQRKSTSWSSLSDQTLVSEVMEDCLRTHWMTRWRTGELVSLFIPSKGTVNGGGRSGGDAKFVSVTRGKMKKEMMIKRNGTICYKTRKTLIFFFIYFAHVIIFAHHPALLFFFYVLQQPTEAGQQSMMKWYYWDGNTNSD